MRIFDVAVLAFALFGVVAAGSLVALLKPAWRRHGKLGLKIGLVGFVVAMGIAMATTPPKEVMQAEAAARAAQAEQIAAEKAGKAIASAEAKRLADQATLETRQRQDAARLADDATATEAKQKASRAVMLESQINWSNRLWALATLATSQVKGGDLSGLSDNRYKVGELFIEASGWAASDAKLAYLCSQAADALKNAITAARDGNMSGRPDSYATQMQRWNSQHDQCSATARELRGEPPLNKGKTAG